VALLLEYIIAFIFIAPIYAALRVYVPSATLAPNALIVFFALPAVPLAYSAIIVILLMSFPTIGRSQELYNMMVVFGVGIGLFSQRLSVIEPEQLLALLEGTPVTLNTLRSVFPNNLYAGNALVGESFYNQLLNVFYTVIICFIFMLLARKLYFKGAVGASESAAVRKVILSSKSIKKKSRRKNMLAACLLKEFTLLLCYKIHTCALQNTA
jgi:ABC-2 type transport system permease protein